MKFGDLSLSTELRNSMKTLPAKFALSPCISNIHQRPYGVNLLNKAGNSMGTVHDVPKKLWVHIPNCPWLTQGL